MSNKSWGISKEVPLSVIVACVMYTVTLIWFFADLQNEVTSNKERIIRDETRIEILEGVVQTQAVSMARIDENIKAIREMAEYWSNR
jgi:hypothetical protein|tara:strand:+ start:2452 stop:2712 length:261 start_codon:yes stop_codon:yes gene_type:complete